MAVKPVQSNLRRTTLLAERYPLPFVLVLLLVWTLPDLALGARTNGNVLLAMLHQALMGGLAVLLLSSLGWWQEAGFNSPSQWRQPAVALIPLLAAALLLRGVGPVSTGPLVRYGTLALLAAFQEEAWHRGVILRTLVPAYGCRSAAAISAAAFAATRVVYLVNEAPGVTLVKALAAGLCGFILTALRLRTRTIWPGMLVAFVFYLGLFLSRGLPHDDMLPVGADRLAAEAFLALVTFLIAVAWMRKVPAEDQVPDVRAG
jgi:membrane protease YdiL (CAAX protease family)